MSLRKPLPFMRFYCDDYLADTPHLSTQEHGAYMLIIMNYWRRQKAIPESRVASIALLSTIEFESIRDTIAELFDIQNGVWTHKRIEAELKRVREESKRNKRAGKKSAIARKNRSDLEAKVTGVERALDECSTIIRSNELSAKAIPISKIRLSKKERELLTARDHAAALEIEVKREAENLKQVEAIIGGSE